MDFPVSAYHRIKLKGNEKRDKYHDLARESKKTLEHEIDSDTDCNWSTRYGHQSIGTGSWWLGNNRTSGDHPNYSIVEIDQNSKKSPGDLRRLAVTQTPLKNHQQRLMWVILEIIICFLYSVFRRFDELLESIMLWIVFFPKTILIFPKDFLNSRFDTIAKQSIINLSRYRSKCYASVVLCDSEVTFLREGEDAVFCPSFCFILFLFGVAKLKK